MGGEVRNGGPEDTQSQRNKSSQDAKPEETILRVQLHIIFGRRLVIFFFFVFYSFVVSSRRGKQSTSCPQPKAAVG
jgi:hypothetical protein